MNTKKLLQKGYFPKELPPPFNTEQYALKSASISRKWSSLLRLRALPIGTESAKDAKRRFYQDYTHKYGSSNFVQFSLAKGIHSRRNLGIPNPKQYHDLCKIVAENWSMLKQSYTLANLSASKPVELEALRAVRTKSKTLNDFKFQLIEKSLNKTYELRLDISNFYPSIYTHSIPWAIMGREEAKKYFKIKNKSPQNWSTTVATDKRAKVYAICDLLDTLVRNCQERQSIGLIIGPDVSFILAEIIGCRIDDEITNSIENLDYDGIRYYDDYYFYANTYGDGERILKKVQSTLNYYGLRTNDSKVKIKEIPFSFEPTWISSLSMFKFTSSNKHELLGFFSIVFKLVEKNPNDSAWIITHSLGRFEYGNILIPEQSWDIFLSLLIKTILLDPSCIDKFLKIILSYKKRLSKGSREKIVGLLNRIIYSHIGLNHSFEVSWSLWIYKTLQIKCDGNILRDVLKSRDYISMIISLDLIFNNLFKGTRPSLRQIEIDLNENDLFSEKWLFTYEVLKHGWIVTTRNILGGNEYMKILFDYNIQFYDPSRQVAPEFDQEDYQHAGDDLPF